jgi:hypothetical protein
LRFYFRVAVTRAGRWSRSQHGYSLRLAGLAPFGFVFELLVVEEKLLAGGENEITPAVDALQYLVLKLHLRMAPFSPFLRAPLAGKELRWNGEKTGLSTSPLVLPLGLGPPRSRSVRG